MRVASFFRTPEKEKAEGFLREVFSLLDRITLSFQIGSKR